jgi:hypothetical protein
MSDERKDFKVSDRRHFTPEGEARATESPSAPAEPTRPMNAAPEEPPPSEDPGEGHAAPADLVGLFVSLAAQASYLLAGQDPSEQGSARPDLRGAREIISLLEVLKAKTEGNRTPDEDSVLDGVLYELRMAYVARSKAGA